MNSTYLLQHIKPADFAFFHSKDPRYPKRLRKLPSILGVDLCSEPELFKMFRQGQNLILPAENIGTEYSAKADF